MIDEEHHSDMDDEEFISKTAVKKALRELQSLGDELVLLPSKKLAQLPLSDMLINAIELAKRLKTGNSRRRQIQRIGKIIRSENPDEIQAALLDQKQQDRQSQQSINPAEEWCDRLLNMSNQDDKANDANTLSEFITLFPESNRQQLGQFIRHAKKEKSEGSASNKYRQKLFKTVQEILLNKS